MKATPVFGISHVDVSITRAEAERAIENPAALVSILRAALAQTREAPAVDDAPEPVAVRTTKAAKSTKPKSKRASFECDCGRKFTSEKYLANHVRKVHEGEGITDGGEE